MIALIEVFTFPDNNSLIINLQALQYIDPAEGHAILVFANDESIMINESAEEFLNIVTKLQRQHLAQSNLH